MQAIISKKELTNLFLKELGTTPADEKELKEFLWAWWINPLSPTSMRLTGVGHVLLSTKLNLKKYEFSLPEEFVFTSKMLLKLDKHLTSPFFIQKKKITIYGESDSIMMALHGGNLMQYLNTFEDK